MLTEKTKAYVQQCYRYIEANQLQERVRKDGLTFICGDHVIEVGVDHRERYTFNVQSDCVVLPAVGGRPGVPRCGAAELAWESVDFVSVWEEGHEVMEIRSRARLNRKTQEVTIEENPDAHEASPETLQRQFVVLPNGREREVTRGLAGDQSMRLYAFQPAKPSGR